MIDCPYLIKPGTAPDMKKRKTDDQGPFGDKSDAIKPTRKNLDRMAELQEVLYAQAKHALLIVIQAMDTGGKDGAIEHVFGGINPQGCRVSSFKKPTELELAHDFLWRAHVNVPPLGMIGIFNRSHYEDVLVVRVHELVAKKVWSSRYAHINAFEKMLADEGVTIIKFFLHISKDEQKERLEARLADKQKHWKFSVNDLAERKRWDDYQQAYEDALRETSTPWAPWYAVPADRKWFRNWVLSETLVRTLERMDLHFPPAPEGLDQVKVV